MTNYIHVLHMRCMHKIDRRGGGSKNCIIGNYQDFYQIFIILNVYQIVLKTLCTAYYSYLKLIFLSLTYFVSPASQGCKILVTLIFLTPPLPLFRIIFFQNPQLKNRYILQSFETLGNFEEEKIFRFQQYNGAFGCPKMSIARSPLRLKKKT